MQQLIYIMYDILIYKCQTTNTKFNIVMKSNIIFPTKYMLLKFRDLECEIIGDIIKYYKIIPCDNFMVNNILVQINKRLEIPEIEFPNINKNNYDSVIIGTIDINEKKCTICTPDLTYYKISTNKYDINSIIPKDIL